MGDLTSSKSMVPLYGPTRENAWKQKVEDIRLKTLNHVGKTMPKNPSPHLLKPFPNTGGLFLLFVPHESFKFEVKTPRYIQCGCQE